MGEPTKYFNGEAEAAVKKEWKLDTPEEVRTLMRNTIKQMYHSARQGTVAGNWQTRSLKELIVGCREYLKALADTTGEKLTALEKRAAEAEALMRATVSERDALAAEVAELTQEIHELRGTGAVDGEIKQG